MKCIIALGPVLQRFAISAVCQEFRMFVTNEYQDKIYALDANGDVTETYDIPGIGFGIIVNPFIYAPTNPNPSIIFSTLQYNSSGVHSAALYKMDMDGTNLEYLYSPHGKFTPKHK